MSFADVLYVVDILKSVAALTTSAMAGSIQGVESILSVAGFHATTGMPTNRRVVTADDQEGEEAGETVWNFLLCSCERASHHCSDDETRQLFRSIPFESGESSSSDSFNFYPSIKNYPLYDQMKREEPRFSSSAI
jgi:hypothetical protein